MAHSLILSCMKPKTFTWWPIPGAHLRSLVPHFPAISLQRILINLFLSYVKKEEEEYDNALKASWQYH